MRGMPKWLNSKEDVYLVVQLAIEGQLPKSDVRKKVSALLSDEKVWQFKKTVDAGYVAGEGEKVVESRDFEGNVRYECYELVDNQHARYIQMGLTKEEIQNILNELKED